MISSNSSMSDVRITLSIDVKGTDSRVTRRTKVVLGKVNRNSIQADANRLISKAVKLAERYCWLAGNEVTNWKLSGMTVQERGGPI